MCSFFLYSNNVFTQRVKTLILVSTIPALISCVQVSGSNQIEISDQISFDLLPPDTWESDVVLTQLAEIRYSGDTQELLFVTEISGGTMSIVGLMTNGTRIFSIQYDGKTITSDGYQALLRRVQPAYLLADFQISQWPLELLGEQLNKTSDCFMLGDCTIAESNDTLSRTVYREGEVVMKVSYGGIPHIESAVTLENPERGYMIRLENLDIEYL